MTCAHFKPLVALTASAMLLAGSAFAQQSQPSRDQQAQGQAQTQAQAQDNSCRELITLLQRTDQLQGGSVSLDQARTYRDDNNQQACRQALANIAQSAHSRAGVNARDSAPGGAAQQTQGDKQMQSQSSQQAQGRIPSQYRHERGRIVAIHPVRVRGVNTPNYLVVVETRPGRQMVADIGQNVRTMNLQSGAPVAVRGQVVRIGNNKALLLADAIRVGDRTFDVDRPVYQRSAQN